MRWTMAHGRLSSRAGLSMTTSSGVRWDWGQLARRRNCHLHVGRVNSARRIAICAAAGATSYDGSSASRFATSLPPLDKATRQPDLFAATNTWADELTLGLAA